MSDREEFLRGDFSFLDIDEQMFRDAGAIYGEDSVCAAQDRFDRLLRLAAGWACQHEGDAFFRCIGGSGGAGKDGEQYAYSRYDVHHHGYARPELKGATSLSADRSLFLVITLLAAPRAPSA